MHLRSITMKGFKSFPDRTRLEFSPGVSVIVGPNGSGKSNVTDAVLWALGEQSPLAVRGQSMQDVIFAGGHGLAARKSAEVEVVIDNSDDGLDCEFSELSILRRLDRSGDGEYRLNGARCRLVDVIEALSDTGLGKEMHSVVSQGRVEAIIHSKPRDRRLLIEEAAGLGKHRKRRRRAQLKLERTEDNLSRALDVEREARSRLRPLKRQAEAAELHERLERQSLEARLELARDAVRADGGDLSAAETAAASARAEREQAERLLAEVAARRDQVERAFTAQGMAREGLSKALYAARAAADAIGLRLERVEQTESGARARAARLQEELAALDKRLAGQLDAQEGDRGQGTTNHEQKPAAAGQAVEGRTGTGRELAASPELRAAAAAAQATHEGCLRAQSVLASAEAEAAALGEGHERLRELLAEAAGALGAALADAGESVAAVRRASEPGADDRAAAELRADRSRAARLRLRAEAATALVAAAAPAAKALAAARDAVTARAEALDRELAAGGASGELAAGELRDCAQREVELQGRLRLANEAVTQAEVSAQQLRDRAGDSRGELERVAAGLGLDPATIEPAQAPLAGEARAELEARVARLARRREQLGPVNPLAKAEYDEAIDHVEDLETQRCDLESALGELDRLIKETDRRIREAFEETFTAAAKNFEEVVEHLFPGGRGRLRLVQPDGPRPVIGGAAEPGAETASDDEAEPGAGEDEEQPPPDEPGVEVEVTPAGKSMKRLSLLSGGEKSLVALAFMFAVFLARPCPFYVLDEVEAALDDLNIDRFLQLVRRYSDRAQFIVVTHQKRTMDAADCLYGVSMGGDGVSRVVSRKLSPPVLESLPGGDEAEAAA